MMFKKNTQHLDEEFAVAADDFFAGTIVRTDREDAELSVLLNTLERVDEAFNKSSEAEARDRIRKNLRMAWFEIEAEKTAQGSGILAQLRDFFRQNRLSTRFAVSFAMILLILVAAPAFFGNQPEMAGTAGGRFSSPLFIVLLVGLVSTLFWILRPPK